MKALIKARPQEGADFTETTTPNIMPNEVLVKVHTASVCGTDLHIYGWDEWAASRMKIPMVFGHECSGEVVEIGSEVREIKVGSHVSVETHILCGKCVQCKTGLKHLCQNVKVVGIDRPGAFAQYLALPAENVWINDSSLPFEIGTVLEPFGNAVYVVNSGEVSGKHVLITGCGPIGMMATQLARAMGALSIYVADIHPYRLALGRKMGATKTINTKTEDLYASIMALTHGQGVDVLLEMSGACEGIAQGFRCLRNGGTAVVFGLPNKPIPFDLANHVILKGAKVLGVFGREIYRTWFQAKELIDSGRVDLHEIVTHQFPLEKFPDAMKLLESGECGKVVLRI